MYRTCRIVRQGHHVLQQQRRSLSRGTTTGDDGNARFRETKTRVIHEFEAAASVRKQSARWGVAAGLVGGILGAAAYSDENVSTSVGALLRMFLLGLGVRGGDDGGGSSGDSGKSSGGGSGNGRTSGGGGPGAPQITTVEVDPQKVKLLVEKYAPGAVRGMVHAEVSKRHDIALKEAKQLLRVNKETLQYKHELEKKAALTNRDAAARQAHAQRQAQLAHEVKVSKELAHRQAQQRKNDLAKQEQEVRARKNQAAVQQQQRATDHAEAVQREKADAIRRRRVAAESAALALTDARKLTKEIQDREATTRSHEKGLAERRRRDAIATEAQLAGMREEEEVRRSATQQARELALVEARAKAESAARAREERENEDVRVRARAQQGDINTTRAVLVASKYLDAARDGARALVTDPVTGAGAVGLVLGLACAVFGARQGFRLLRTRLEAVLGQPSLIRDTNVVSTPRQAVAAAFRRLGSGGGSESGGQAALRGVVLEPTMDARVRSLAQATRNTQRNEAPFRHVLFYGPPGTGKTLVAKKLAEHSGLSYAVMSGGDVAPLRSRGVTEIHKLFQWAQASRGGLILFIDEAEAFLKRRSDMGMSEDMRSCLNALLYNTGTASDKFMLVLATNRPGDLDLAVSDRVDEQLCFDLPGPEERKRLLHLFLSKYFDRNDRVTAAKDARSDVTLDTVVAITDGFSGRGLEKLVISAQGRAFGTASDGGDDGAVDQPMLTAEMLLDVARVKVEQFARRREMAEKQETAGNFV
tara:strand:- start:328 stop:2607 length:2280 start_codon:yes stop_codon:yes gene_type:complete